MLTKKDFKLGNRLDFEFGIGAFGERFGASERVESPVARDKRRRLNRARLAVYFLDVDRPHARAALQVAARSSKLVRPVRPRRGTVAFGGRFGHDFHLHDRFRPLSKRRTHAVATRVAAAYNQHAFVFCRNCRLVDFAAVYAVLRSEKFEREMDAVEVAPRDVFAQSARNLRAETCLLYTSPSPRDV